MDLIYGMGFMGLSHMLNNYNKQGKLLPGSNFSYGAAMVTFAILLLGLSLIVKFMM